MKRIETKEKDLLKKELKRVKNNLEAKAQIICEAKECVAQKTDKCVKRLEEATDKLVEFITKAKNQRNESDLKADEIVSLIKENIGLLNNIEEKLVVKGGTDCDVKSYHETVKGIIENNKNKLSGTKLFQFPVLDQGEISNEITSIQITSEEFLAVMPDEDIETEETQNPHLHAFQLHCIGTLLLLL